MKKVGIITLNGNFNYGNRLQNYALKTYVEKLNLQVETIWIESIYSRMKFLVKNTIKRYFLGTNKRYLAFRNFSRENLNISNYTTFKKEKNYDFFIVGSDQVWNYHFPEFNRNMFLEFSPIEKNISYAASFGIDNIEDAYQEMFQKGLSNFNYLSVREEKGRELINKLINKNDTPVHIDPTMLIDVSEWNKIVKKPKKLTAKKYILTYFLGKLPIETEKEIQRLASSNDCEIINLLDKNGPFYECGPSEFVYLEKEAFMVCTDSFHACVFAFLYNKPFVVFDRIDKEEKMNSRIQTLLRKFKLENREFKDKITLENINHDYSIGYEILEKEREKSKDYLEKALKIK